MHFRRTVFDRVTFVAGFVLIFISAAFAQRLSPGSKPVETDVSDVPEAFCSNLSGGFRVCRVRKNEDRDAEFIIQKGGVTATKIDADVWSTIAVEPKDFFAYRGDLDRDGSAEIVIVSLDGVSQGMGVSYATAYIFAGRSIGSGTPPISFPIQEFGENDNFIYDPKTRRTRVLLTYWDGYNSIDPKRGWGLYLIGKWFTYKSGKLQPILTEPTLARRFLNSFAAERDNGWFENRRPFAWLRDRRTHRLLREPKTTAKLLKVTLGKIDAYIESADGGAEFGFVTDKGERITAQLNSSTEQKKGDALDIAAVGMWTRQYLYPISRSSSFRLSSFLERIEGRRVRLETYQHEFGDEFTRIWFLD